MSKKIIDTNPNSPECVFSDWLFKQTLAFYDKWHRDESIWSEVLLNHIFWFARSHGKTYEMFLWLNTPECYKLFKETLAGKMILRKYDELYQSVDDNVGNLSDIDAVVSEVHMYYSRADNLEPKLKLF